METTEKYKVSINGMISIQWSDEVGRLLEAVKEHLSKACMAFLKNKNMYKDSDDVYYKQCVSIAIYNMTSDMLDVIEEFKAINKDNTLDMKQVGSLLYRLIIISDTIEQLSNELLMLNIDIFVVSSEIRLSIAPLDLFVERLIRKEKQ